MKDNPKYTLILQSGSECFARFGFDKTTLDDIGRRAGLNKASLYYYFKNKEEIFVAVVRAETQAFIGDLQAKAAAYPDIRRQIRFYLTERIRRYGEVVHLTRLSVDSFHKLAPLFDEVHRETSAGEIVYLTGLLRKAAQENAILINEPSAMLAERLFHLSDALKHNAARETGNISAQLDFAPAIAEMEYWTKMVLR
jgi:AcrR family transcriptional regulator